MPPRPRSASVFEDVKEGAEKLKQEGIDRLSGKDKKSAMQEEMAPVVSRDRFMHSKGV